MRHSRSPVSSIRRKLLSGLGVGLLAGCLRQAEDDSTTRTVPETSKETPLSTPSSTPSETRTETSVSESSFEINWPQFLRNPAKTGHVSSENGPVESVTVYWKNKISHSVRSNAVARNNTVYVGSEDRRIYALDKSDGTIRWTFETDGAVSFAPVINDDSLVLGSKDGFVYNVTTAKGNEQWRVDLGGPVSGPITIAESNVYAITEKTIHTLDPTDGSERWSFEVDGDHCSPVSVGNGVVCVCGYDQVYALDPKDGNVLWQKQADVAISVPTVSEGSMYFQGLGGRAVRALDLETGKQQWQVKSNGAYSPSVANGLVYVPGDGRIFACDKSTGKVRWETSTDGVAFAPIIANDTIYVGYSNQERIEAFDAETGTRLWTHNLGLERVRACSVGDGVLLVTGGEDGTVYALGG